MHQFYYQNLLKSNLILKIKVIISYFFIFYLKYLGLLSNILFKKELKLILYKILALKIMHVLIFIFIINLFRKNVKNIFYNIKIIVKKYSNLYLFSIILNSRKSFI